LQRLDNFGMGSPANIVGRGKVDLERAEIVLVDIVIALVAASRSGSIRHEGTRK